MTISAVTDAGPIIHLAEIDSLELLEALDTLIVPATVLNEVEAGGTPGELATLSYEYVDVEVSLKGDEDLDAGERTAIAVANERSSVLLTDDLAARKTASDMGIDVHGSIGVIALGHSRGLIDKDEAVGRMRALQRETSLFVTEAVVERGIRMLNEE